MNDKVKDNMELWNSVEKSSPYQLSKITFGRGFISINAHSQVKKATEVFGVMGEGWKVEGEIVGNTPEDFCIIQVNAFRKVEGGWSAPVTQFGCAEWKSAKGKMDVDAPKKAMTDGMTKCLSYWGMNADVFLSEWDNKDIDQAKRAENAAEDTKSVSVYVDNILACANMDELKTKYMEVPNHLKAAGTESAELINKAKDEMKVKLK